MTRQQIIKSAGERLRASSYGKSTAVMSKWMTTTWHTAASESLNDAMLLPSNGDKTDVRLNSTLERLAPLKAQVCVLREFALAVLKSAGTKGKAVWEHKLGLPHDEQIDSFQNKIESEELRATTKSYKQLVESYPRAVDRLVALNLANALIANHIPYADSRGVKIRSWGPTIEYTSGRRYHTIAAIAPVYTPIELCFCFGKLFAEAVLNDMKSVSESSVAAAWQELIELVVAKAA